MTKLVVCMRCARHVLAREVTCPFCGASVAKPIRSLGSLATASVVVAVLSACGGTQANQPPEDPTEVKAIPPEDPSEGEATPPADTPNPDEPPPVEPPPEQGPGPVALYAPPPR